MIGGFFFFCFFFSSRRRHTRSYGDWSSDVCSSDLHDPTRTLSSSGAGCAHVDWELGIGNGTAPGGSPGRWLARFGLSRHPNVVRRCPGATEPVPAPSRERARALPPRAGLDVLLSDGGPTPGRRTPGGGGESDAGS